MIAAVAEKWSCERPGGAICGIDAAPLGCPFTLFCLQFGVSTVYIYLPLVARLVSSLCVSGFVGS